MDRTVRVPRRALLSGAAASLALPAIMRPANARVAAYPAAPWNDLAKRLNREVMTPFDPRFGDLTRPENSRYRRPGFLDDPDAPLAVVQPANPAQVGITLQWCHENAVRMVPRSGGHSYAGCSTIRGLTVHSGAMRDVSFDKSKEILSIGGGALNIDIFNALKDDNCLGIPKGYSIVHGRCGDVGASAFFLGGGVGFSMRLHGLGCDLIEQVELVKADGTTVTVNRRDPEPEKKNLFWALLGGGGGNLGYVTRWWLRPVQVGTIVVFRCTWDSDGKDASVFNRLVSLLEDAPREVGAILQVARLAPVSEDNYRINLTGQFHGTEQAFYSIFGTALDDAKQAIVLEMPYWTGQKFLGQNPFPNKYQETSRFVTTLPPTRVAQLFDRLRAWPGTKAQTIVSAFLAGGKVNEVAADATAFVHRNAKWLIDSDLDWSNGENEWDSQVQASLNWQRGLQEDLASWPESGGSYQNFPDQGLADHTQAYWGKNWQRLRDIKFAIDPGNLFQPPRNQGIIP